MIFGRHRKDGLGSVLEVEFNSGEEWGVGMLA